MQKSHNWKLALLNDAIPKFSAAVQGCDATNTFQIQTVVKNFIALLQNQILLQVPTIQLSGELKIYTDLGFTSTQIVFDTTEYMSLIR
jgi:hypothetical protein